MAAAPNLIEGKWCLVGTLVLGHDRGKSPYLTFLKCGLSEKKRLFLEVLKLIELTTILFWGMNDYC